MTDTQQTFPKINANKSVRLLCGKSLLRTGAVASEFRTVISQHVVDWGLHHLCSVGGKLKGGGDVGASLLSYRKTFRTFLVSSDSSFARIFIVFRCNSQISSDVVIEKQEEIPRNSVQQPIFQSNGNLIYS